MSRDDRTLPSPIVTLQEDGSLAFAWYGDDMRLLMSFEKNPEDSGWHIVRKISCGINDTPPTCGRFDEFNPERFASWLEEIGAKKIE